MIRVFKLIFSIIVLFPINVFSADSSSLAIEIEWFAPQTLVGCHFYHDSKPLGNTYEVVFSEFTPDITPIPSAFLEAETFNVELHIKASSLGLDIHKTDIPTAAGIAEHFAPPSLPEGHTYCDNPVTPLYYITLVGMKPGTRITIKKADDNKSLIHSVS